MEEHVRAAQPGDVVEVLVADSEGDESFQKAIIQSAASNCQCYVQYLEQPADEEVTIDGDTFEREDVLRVSNEVHAVPVESLNRRWIVDDSTARSMTDTMRAAGIVPLPEEDCLRFFEVLSEDDDSDAGSLCDFITADDEPFELADEKESFVAETHAAVREFNDWHPEAGSQGARIKVFVENLAGAAEHANEDTRFEHNMGPETRYRRPPV